MYSSKGRAARACRRPVVAVIVAALVLGARAASVCGAGERAAAGGAPALGLDDAIREALDANRDLRAAYFAIVQARARLIQAGLWANPALQFSGTHDSAFANEGEYTASAGFEQRFPVAGRLGRARDVARVDVAIALAEVRDASRRLIGEVETAFYDLAILNAQAAVRTELVDHDRRLVEVSEGRAKLAEVSALDVNAARIELDRVELERNVLTAQAHARAVELNRLLGRAPDQPLQVAGEVAVVPTPALAWLRAEALRRRPDLQRMALDSDRARAERALAKAEQWEDWTIGFSYDRDHQVIDGAPAQGDGQFLGWRLSVPLPLWNRNQGRIAETSALEAQAKGRVAALELTILAEIESAHRRVDELAEVTERYRVRLVPLTDQNVRLSQDAYRQGLVNVTQVVQAQRQHGELQSAYLDALIQYRRALTELEVAAATSRFLKSPEES
jgi:cobalt-zinc-cadmium efflux system outer membrane protein